MGTKFKPVPIELPTTFRMALVHAKGKSPCNQVAFYYRHPDLTHLCVDYADLPDGTKPKPFEDIRCGSCGEVINLSDLMSLDEVEIEKLNVDLKGDA